LVVNNVHLFKSILDHLVVAVDQSQVLVHLNDLSVAFVRSWCRFTICVSGIDLELCQPRGQLLIILLKVVNLGLARRYSLEQRRVGLFSYLEAPDHGLDVGDTSVRLDLLESVVNAAASLHLLVHLSLHEVVPQLVNVEVVTHLKLSGVFALVGGSFSDLLVLLLTLNSALHGLFLVRDAALELKDALLSITLFFLNILHQVVEDVFGLELGFLGFASTAFLTVEDLALVPKTSLEVVRLDLVRNEVFLHPLEHVEISAFRHVLLVNLVIGLPKALFELRKPLLVVSDGAFDLGLLDFKASNFFPDAVVLLLLERDELFGLVVLLLDLGELHGNFIDLLLDVLVRSCDICWLKERVLLHELVCSVIDLELLLHDCASSARELVVLSTSFTVTVH